MRAWTTTSLRTVRWSQLGEMAPWARLALRAALHALETKSKGKKEELFSPLELVPPLQSAAPQLVVDLPCSA
jgi:hypothetical protein